jgi:GNAT superfamily N-acetyltransferase
VQKAATHNATSFERMAVIERAVAYNLRDYIAAYDRAFPEIKAELLEVAGGVAAFVGVGSPITTVKGIGKTIDTSDLRAIEEFYAARGVKRVVIETAPWFEESGRAFLRAEGYSESGHEDVMTRSQDQPARFAQMENVPPAEWPKLLHDTYELVDSQAMRGMCLATAVLPRVELFGIRIDGIWAACAQTNPYSGAAILGCDGTLPKFRGQGLQARLIRERFERLPQGTLAISEVTPGSTSQRSYLRCGFEIAYTRTHFAKQLH